VQPVNVRTNKAEEHAVAAAARAGDELAFADLAQRYRHELQVHCYRMLGSLDDSEDLVQETFLRAWRKRETYEAPATFRAWLYRIATNACLDFLDHWPHERQVTADPDVAAPPAAMITWLQPYPDGLLDAIAADADEPGESVVARETIELAFLTAIQHLPPRQRAVLIMRDVLGWPAKEAASVLESTVASVNSALQRARPTLRKHLPERPDGAAPEAMDPGERTVLERFMAAVERADAGALGGLLSEDARAGQQPGAGGYDGPDPFLVEGREAILAAWAPVLHGPDAVEFRFMPACANRQPAAAAYVRLPGDQEHHPFALTVLRVEDGTVTDLSAFAPDLFPAFGLPLTL
jgi:RNA polymerase sigma-70 factor, ECF subfamily